MGSVNSGPQLFTPGKWESQFLVAARARRGHGPGDSEAIGGMRCACPRGPSRGQGADGTERVSSRPLRSAGHTEDGDPQALPARPHAPAQATSGAPPGARPPSDAPGRSGAGEELLQHLWASAACQRHVVFVPRGPHRGGLQKSRVLKTPRRCGRRQSGCARAGPGLPRGSVTRGQRPPLLGLRRPPVSGLAARQSPTPREALATRHFLRPLVSN